MKISVLASFVVVLALFIFATQVPVDITPEKVSAAVSEATSQSEVPVDEEVVEQAVKNSITILEKGQRTRLKYLAAAYIVIWLVFMLYVLRLGQQQQQLDKRLAQLEQTSVTVASNQQENAPDALS
ncbi:MAG: CcmD family protein [Candidatus Poribacteria bacterium]|nr:CcmD family protein [Candidatus Poribacteria bacterium]